MTTQRLTHTSPPAADPVIYVLRHPDPGVPAFAWYDEADAHHIAALLGGWIDQLVFTPDVQHVDLARWKMLSDAAINRYLDEMT